MTQNPALLTTLHHPLKGVIDIHELEEAEALAILCSLPTLGLIKAKQLINHFGSARTALQAPSNEIAILPGFGSKICQVWEQWPTQHNWQRNLTLADAAKAELVPWNSPLYPKRLLKIPDHPLLLYMKGKPLACDQKCIAIVGTRQASIYGMEMARQFAADLAAFGFTVVSGLARGIDTAAHVAALEYGRSIAVIGSGLSDVYPAENHALSERISQKGVLMSEFPMATPPDRQNFPQRNRLVSGMTLATLLIEAPFKSGAMITMEKGLTYGKKLFALPGRLDNPNFSGNHALIKSGQAQLVENARDIANSFEDLFGSTTVSQKNAKPVILLDKDELELLKWLPNSEFSSEEIAASTQWPAAKLNVLLMSLVLKKVLREFPGRLYKKI